ncbi:prenyltransferase [Alteromonas sp. CYL-A6]|uniref:prenyltransferase n=1 Tax=Alteromonas nitratireducens TaxID=3390813 RepID=UPI0034AFAEA3
MRPPFLLLVASCLSLPVAYAHYTGSDWSPLSLLLIVLASLSAHIAVNMLNEYQDFCSQLDIHTIKTPFSGGSGALIDAPGRLRTVWWTAWLFVSLTVICGLILIALQPGQSLMLSLLGLAGVGIVVTYTPYINRSPLLCLMAPGLGFGLIMGFGAYLALTGMADQTMLAVSVIPALLVNNLLLLNQFPDREADKQHGRRHAVVVYGYRGAAVIYALQWVVLIAMLFMLTTQGGLPLSLQLAALAGVPAAVIFMRALRFEETTPHFLTAMGMNVLLTLTLPVLLAVCLWAG